MFFRPRQRTLGDIVKEACNLLRSIQPTGGDGKVPEEVNKNLKAIRAAVLGQSEVLAESNSGAGVGSGNGAAAVVALEAVAAEAKASGFFLLLAEKLGALDWEARKDASIIWSGLLSGSEQKDQGRGLQREEADGTDAGGREEAEAPGEEGEVADHDGEESGGGAAKGRSPRSPEQLAAIAVTCGVLQHLEEHPAVVEALGAWYAHRQAVAQAGGMLRECLRSAALTHNALSGSTLPAVVKACDSPSFDVASDAFTSLKELLMRHKAVAAEFLQDSYDEFFPLFETLLKSDNYVTRRQATKLLGELLVERSNMAVMLRFIQDAHNLRLIMGLLRDPSRAIQYEAFHVFKVFVANPRKGESIRKLLLRNRERLVAYLQAFELDREEEEFDEEKATLIRAIQKLEM